MTEATKSPATELSPENHWEGYHLRLFFSADVVGSTAFKQKPEGGANGELGADPAWFGMVLSFYHQAEKAFAQHWENYEKQFQQDGRLWFGEAPEVWKTVGDEVLFTKIVSHPMQAIMAIHAWCHTLDDLRRQLRSKFSLDVKSCVWLADFPLRNQEVVLGHIKSGEDDDYPVLNREGLAAFYGASARSKHNMLRDFIGPAIDTGFRLGALSSPRKLIVSLELAHLLAVEQAYAESNPGWHSKGPSEIRKFVFRYDGKHILKGVLGGHPYPVFWIDLDTESVLNRAEDSLVRSLNPTSHEIKAFTAAMLDEHPKYLARPCFERNEGEPVMAPDHSCIDEGLSKALEDRATHFRMKEERLSQERSDIARKTEGDGEEREASVRAVIEALERLTRGVKPPEPPMSPD